MIFPQTISGPNPESSFYKTSSQKHYILAQSLKAPRSSGCYLAQIIVELDHHIDADRFSTAWLEAIRRSANLTLGYRLEKEGASLQFVKPINESHIEFHDWNQFSKEKTNEFISTFLQADRRLGFDISDPPLFRITLIKTAAQRFLLIWSFHSAIADEALRAFVLKDFFNLYIDPYNETVYPNNAGDASCESINEQNYAQAAHFWRSYLKGQSNLSKCLSEPPKPPPQTTIASPITSP